MFASTDGGLHWERQSFPRAAVPLDIECTDARHCVAVDPAGFVATTVDGGSIWTNHWLSTSPANASLTDVACGDPEHCWAVGVGVIAASADGGSTWEVQSRTDIDRPGGITCLDRRNCVAVGSHVTAGVGAIVTTTDGGATWVAQKTPLGVSALHDVACSTAIGCRAVGQVAEGWSIQPYAAAVLAPKRPSVIRPVRLGPAGVDPAD